MAAYIIGTGAISPQQTFEVEELGKAKSYEGNRLTCIEPNYSSWLDVKQLRRMSRVMKVGAAAAKLALKNAGIEVPDAVITGTGLGCLDDTGIFLEKLIEYKEETLNPTPFIQSTHNTIGSHIAFLLQCLSYNQTYSHGAFSFENALLDGLLHLEENSNQKILVGAADEITNNSHTLIERFGILKRASSNSLRIFESNSKGTLNGEGSAWFVLSGEPDSSKIKVEGVATTFNHNDISDEATTFLNSLNISSHDIDFILLGKSGDLKLDMQIDLFSQSMFPDKATGVYKHLCGEYYTSTSIALWLAHSILKTGKIPEEVSLGNTNLSPNRILIYNRYLQDHHSLILVSKE